MNLDNLISKYLDGELSRDEDEQLRSILSEEDGAKDDFDSAVLLNAAIKEDADSIKAPASVLRDTEDKIAMAIMSRRDTGVAAFYRRRKYYSYAAVLLLFLLATFYRIYDSYPIDKSGVMAESMNKMKSNLISNQFEDEFNQFIMPAPEEKYSKKISAPSSPKQKKQNPVTNNMSYAMISSMPETKMSNEIALLAMIPPEKIALQQPTATKEAVPDMVKDISEKTVNSANMQLSTTSLLRQPVTAHNAAFSVPGRYSAIGNSSSFFDFYQNSDNILITSFLGTEIMNTGIETNKDMMVSHISQSVAYALDNENAFGVEIGLSQYSYDEVGSISYSVEDFEQIDNGMQVESYKYGNMVTEKVIYQRTKEVFWSSAFYERQKVFSDGFTLNGRVGLGANSEGPLGYTRLFAKVAVFNGIYMTGGVEGRLFYLDLPELMTSAPQMRGSLILSYGLQFIF